MAETAVNFVIEKLIPLLINEARLQKALRSQTQGIKQDLETIQSFLRDADVRAEREESYNSSSNVVKDWVRRVRDVAHRMEDVIDEYRFQVAKRRQVKSGLVGLFQKAGRLVTNIKPSHEITSEIEEIKAALGTLKERRETFESSLALGAGAVGSSSPGPNGSSWQEHKLRAHFMDETQVVGIESPRDTLVASLLHDTPTRKLIPVVGTGGLGKTTLVRKVYDHEKVERTFQCKAWVEVTRSFKVEDILKKLIKQFQKNIDLSLEVDKKHLINEAREYLKGKRYLVVFDDVWAADFWRRIELALPANEKGSRIIITTRHQKVADFAKGSASGPAVVEPFHLKPLQHQDAMKLFYQKAFQFDQNGQCPDRLKRLSSDIVKKCGSIPLAIVAIGSLLSTKNNDVSEWKKVHDGLGSRLGNDLYLRAFNAVLSESYHDLPYHLKLCFLYFGIFPEDYSISCKRLIRLWIAEGFVEETPDSTLEEVGGEYLRELINRSLVQVSWVDFDGKVRSCRVHDLMHEFILKKCKELNFCPVTTKNDSNFNAAKSPRRLMIHESNYENSILEAAGNRIVRSCFVFSSKGLPKSSIITFRLLRILDFDDGGLDFLPDEVGQLLHLRYLSLRNTRTKTLPKSIGKLCNLITLDLKNSMVLELPEEINSLTKLRHLVGYSFDEDIDFNMGALTGMKIKEGFGHLKSLQKLYSVDVSEGGAPIIKELKKLRQLKKLGITKLRRQNGRALCSAIETMTSLLSLSIGAVDENEFLDLQPLTHPPQNLQRLYLKGRLEKLPEWVSKVKTLVKLHLNWSGLIEDPLTALKDLPELLELGLRGGYEGDELHFKEGRLLKLKILRLRNLQRLKTLKIDEGALPNLEKLHVGPCPQLVEVPNDIRNLRKLQTLRFYDMPDGFTHSMDPTKQNHFKIQHVPSVLFFNKKGSGNRYFSNSLHYMEIMKNRYGSDDFEIGSMLESREVDEAVVPVRVQPHPLEMKGGTTDKWFWVTALLLSLLVVILAFLSKFLEQASFWIS